MRKSLYVLFLVFFVIVTSQNDSPLDKCGGNCPSNDCATCPCGITKSETDVPTACAQFTGWDQECCRCIVRHESGGNLNAVNENSGGSYDVGLWQINSGNWAACAGGATPCSLAANLGCAQYVWKAGGGTFKLWSTAATCNCTTNPPSTTHSVATTQTQTGPSNTHTSYSSGSVNHAEEYKKQGGEGSVPYQVNVILN